MEFDPRACSTLACNLPAQGGAPHGRLSQIQPDASHVPQRGWSRDGGRGWAHHHRPLGSRQVGHAQDRAMDPLRAVGRADLTGNERLEMDARLALQPGELGAPGAAHRGQGHVAHVVRRAGSRDGVGDRGPRLAAPAVHHRDHPPRSRARSTRPPKSTAPASGRARSTSSCRSCGRSSPWPASPRRRRRSRASRSSPASSAATSPAARRSRCSCSRCWWSSRSSCC